MAEEPKSLKFLSSRAIGVTLFKVNIRWRMIHDVAYALADVLRSWRLPPKIRIMLTESVREVLAEVRRWDDKHKEMFVEAPRGALKTGNLLREYYAQLVWKHSCFEIDDRATAVLLMKKERAVKLQFQFACLYAMNDIVEDMNKFSKCRRTTFKKLLGDHPVYDFWLTLTESNWEVFFDTDTRVANQKLQLCFKFAITHGYCELMTFIWDKIGNTTKEYIESFCFTKQVAGLLQWRAMCFRARDRDTMRFLCSRLCQMNAHGVARVAWTAFWSTFYDMINNEESDVVEQQKFKRRFEFLIENCCPELRRRLLNMENFRIVSDAFRYNRADTFALLLEHMDGEQLRNAREVVDRIHDRQHSQDGERLRRALLRRQMTTAD